MRSRIQVFMLGVGLVAVAVFLLACGDAPPKPLTFFTALAGADEVPPNSSTASGTCTVVVDPTKTSLDFNVTVSNINNVFASHLHSVGTAGQVVGVTLPFFSGPANSGLKNGVLASGTLHGSDLTGVFGGHPLSDLVDSMLNGTTYCNVHTSGTGITAGQPGNIPGGEIRGQMKFVRASGQ